MIELELPYLNALASHLIYISAFLGGFAATLLGTLIISDKEGKLIKTLIISSALSAVSFIVAVMAMTSILLVTTKGYPLEINPEDVVLKRAIGGLAMLLGLISLLVVISVSGWLKSKKLGFITSLVGIIGFVLIILCS